MFRLSWAITTACTLAVLTGILIVTRDLNESNEIFKDGVLQAQTVDNTTDRALHGAAQLPPANDAIHLSTPQVLGVIDSLVSADATLGSLAEHLSGLSEALRSADAPLQGIIAAGSAATDQATAAAVPAGVIADTLVEADAKARALGPLLDRTIALSNTIDSKLRIALLLPVVGN